MEKIIPEKQNGMDGENHMKIKKRLTFLENKIDNGMKDFYEIGKSLKKIKDERLYRVVLFNQFSTYTKSRWDIGKSKAYRLINACNVIDNLSPIGDRLPLNEAQIRPLVRFKKDEQRKIWREFLESGMEITARNIINFTDRYQKTTNQTTTNQTDIMSKPYKNVVMLMMGQINMAQNEGWQKTSRQSALMWNRVMREKIISQSYPISGDKDGQ